MQSAWEEIFQDTPVDRSTISDQLVEYIADESPISTLGVPYNQLSSTYHIKTKDLDQWLDINKSYLNVRFRVTTSAGQLITATTGFSTLIAGGMHLFDRAEIKANGSLIDYADKPGYVQLITSLMDMHKDKIDSVAEAEWMHLDEFGIAVGNTFTVGANNAVPTADSTKIGVAAGVKTYAGFAEIQRDLRVASATVGAASPNPRFNQGFFARWFRTQGDEATGKEVELAIPLERFLGFARDIDHPLRGIQFELALVKNTNYNEILHVRADMASGADADALIGNATVETRITKVSWWVPQVEPSLEVQAQLAKELDSGNGLYKKYFEHMSVQISAFYANASGSTFDWLVETTSHRPTKIVVGFQDDAKFNLRQDTEPLCANGGIFSNLSNGTTKGVSTVEVRINNKIVPRERYDLSFAKATPNYMRAYIDFLKASGKYNTDEGSAVSYEGYSRLYPLFVFDLSAMDDTYSGTKQNDIRIKATVDIGTATGYRAVALVVSERQLDLQPINGRIALKV